MINKAEDRLLECSLTNTKAGMQTLLGKRQKLPGFDQATTLICMEHTGLYCQPMVSFFYALGGDLWLQSAVQIKQSLGVKRGKTDKADAPSIATYSLRHQKDLRLFCLTDSVLAKVRQLASQRERLMEMAKQLTDIAQDYKAMGLVEELKLHEQTSELVLLALKKQIAQVDRQIDTEIKADRGLQTRVDLLTSIPGVGRQTALYMLIFTANFTRFDDPKKLASYAGVAPFAYESGTSVRGRTQVSPMANKKLKHLLHMAALGAVRVEGDLKHYFERKVGAGKRKMSVLNAVRNKIVHRIMAVMERGTAYTKVYAKIG
ncbi:transposase [Spirosoma sp. SC4-14]|uniref:transposase n=1 Tax=Spirosoma sp. SC4-14 TaxID=3128900 RepID=UPI0030D36A82